MTPDDLFSRAYDFTRGHEGGFVDHPTDPGGATNYGVSLRFLRDAGQIDRDSDGLMDGDLDGDGDIDVDDIRLLTPEVVRRVFKYHFWDRFDLAALPPAIAVKAFDLSVNTGPRPAFRALQRACRACRRPIADDGVIGEQTRAAVEYAHDDNPAALMAAYCAEIAGFYRGLVSARPDEFKPFLRGWLNRAYVWPQSQVEGL